MRILFLLTSDLESPAGSGRYLPIARELTKLGHQVTLATLHSNYSLLDDKVFEVEGVKVIYAGQMQVLKKGNEKLYFPMYKLFWHMFISTIHLTKIALTVSSDIIHIGKPHPMNSLAGLVSKFITNKILVLDYDDYEIASGHFNSKIQKTIVRFFEDKMPTQVEMVTTHTSFLWQRLQNLGVPQNRIAWLPNGVDFARFSKSDPELVAKLRQSFGLENRKTVAFIGSLSAPSHPIDLLINAFEVIYRQDPETKLLIVGGGEEYYQLKDKANLSIAAEQIIFVGRVPTKEISAYYKLADVLVDPVEDNEVGRSRLPLKLFECWAAGIPFVTCDVGDRRKLLSQPAAGLVTKPGDPEALARGISKVLNDPALSLELVQNGFQKAKDFEWSILVTQLADDYQHIIQSKRK